MGWSSSPYEERIWDLLLASINNEYGVAGLMGNLFAESGLYPLRIQRSDSTSPINTYYNSLVNNGTISKEEFAVYPDGYNSLGWYYSTASGGVKSVYVPGYGTYGKGWGLAQWTTADRKRNMYDRCFPDIGNLERQVSFLIWELQSHYSGTWNILLSATSIAEASDYVLTHFEQPPEETWESEKVKRRRYSEKIYEANTGRPPVPVFDKILYGAVRDVLRRLIIHA